jgi:FkbH-like protein
LKTLNSILISDFTISNLAGYISNSLAEPRITCSIAPFNQVHSILLNPDLKCLSGNIDLAVIWCQPERIIPGFGKLLNNETDPHLSIETILKETDDFITSIKTLRGRVRFSLIASFATDPKRFSGLTSLKNKSGIQNILMQMNLRMVEGLQESEGFYLLDSQRWIASAGAIAFQPQLWYLSKTPFHNSVFEIAAREIHSSVRGILGMSKKLIVIDLDDTLWGGILGDIGWENLVLGGHDATGEAYVDFQKELKALANKGILLGVLSKNEESVALTAIEKHPEMILRKKDLAAWRINWNDKAQNIIELVKELNLGLDSVIFIDDNPVERARVRETLPEVFVPELPGDRLYYPSFIRGLDCFNTGVISKEDSNRNRLYAEEKNRLENSASFQSMDEWLSGINIKIKVEQVNKKNIHRVAQLFNKTNQFNLSTRRMTEQEILDWISIQGNYMWAFSVSDKFGDAGLTGITGISVSTENAFLNDFLLSCRIMGRKTEETMLNFSIDQAVEKNCRTLSAAYLPTYKNKPCLSFFEKSGMNRKDNLFTWDCNNKYKIPSYIQFTHEV